MRKIFILMFLLACGAAIFADEPIRQVKADWKTVERSGGKKSKAAEPSGDELIKSSSKYARDLRRQQSRELQQLREIHEYQNDLLSRKQPASATPGKKKEPDFRMQIRRNAMALEDTLKQLPKFPFANQMHEIDKVVSSISSGKLKYGEVTGKTPQKILKTIQEDQEKMLRDFQKQQTKSLKNVRQKKR